MRKYIFSTLLVLAGFLLLIVNYTQKKNVEFAEKAFSIQATNFEKGIEKFYLDAKSNIETIKSHFDSKIIAQDSAVHQAFMLNFLRNSPSVTAMGVFQGENQIVARNDLDSYVFALNTASDTEVVKWHRYAKGKLTSTWFESLNVSIVETPWYSHLIDNSDQLTWYVGNRIKTSAEQNDEYDHFYTGMSYGDQSSKSTILLEYSRDELLKGIKIASKHVKPYVTFRNIDDQDFNFVTRRMDSTMSQSVRDSLQIQIKHHYSNFKDVPDGIFNFKFKNETYWNSFKKLSEESGLKYFIFTIPNSDLTADSQSYTRGLSFWLGIVLVLTGLFLLLVRKRFFYKPNRMSIPALKTILEDDENRFLEFKSSLRWDYRQEKTNPELEKVILKSIAAFGNTDGGTLLIGVDDDKNILGLENDFQTLKKKDPDYYEVHLRNLLHNMMGVKYVSRHIRTKFEAIDQKWVCIIKVLSADEPLYLKYKDKNGQQIEKFYVRSGNSSHEIKSMAEINDYINKRFK